MTDIKQQRLFQEENFCFVLLFNGNKIFLLLLLLLLVEVNEVGKNPLKQGLIREIYGSALNNMNLYANFYIFTLIRYKFQVI